MERECRQESVERKGSSRQVSTDRRTREVFGSIWDIVPVLILLVTTFALGFVAGVHV